MAKLRCPSPLHLFVAKIKAKSRDCSNKIYAATDQGYQLAADSSMTGSSHTLPTKGPWAIVQPTKAPWAILDSDDYPQAPRLTRTRVHSCCAPPSSATPRSLTSSKFSTSPATSTDEDFRLRTLPGRACIVPKDGTLEGRLLVSPPPPPSAKRPPRYPSSMPNGHVRYQPQREECTAEQIARRLLFKRPSRSMNEEEEEGERRKVKVSHEASSGNTPGNTPE